MTRRTPLPDDRAGRIYGLTWPVPLRIGGRLETRLLFWAGRHFGWVSAPLRRLAVIRVAHWSALSHVPDGEGGRRRLRRPVLFFDASFDVDLRRYIEIFGEAIRWRFRAVWGFGAGYPGVLPSEGFLGWVDTGRTDASHFWCAYPEATTRMIASALRVAEGLAALDTGAVTAEVDDDAFSADFRRLLSRLSGDL